MMLSIAKVSSAASAASYYHEADDYYSEGNSAPSNWQGKGAELLGLTGIVDKDKFYELLQGRLPGGSQIHNAADGRRAATDLTLSPSKSVSVQALVFGDDRLIQAHDKAVNDTLKYAEGLAAYRVTDNGETTYVNSGNIIAATFRHETSRDLDPALHTHCVVLNITNTREGNWRALNVTEIYKQQKLLSAYYRSELAQSVKALGYEIVHTHSDGRFELKGFSRGQIESFSQRGAAVEKYLEDRGKTRATASSAEKEMATLATRESKQKVDRIELSAEWKSRAQELGIEKVFPSLDSKAKADPVKEAEISLRYAVEHLTERHSIVTKNEIIQTALEKGVGKTNLSHIEDSLKSFVDRGELLEARDRFTTHEAQVRERQILTMEEKGRGAVRPISDKTSELRLTSLNSGQKSAVKLISLSSNRFVAIQGSAGTGKTTMLKVAKHVAEENGFKFLGAAPSAAAARELFKAGIESKTLAGFQAADFRGLNEKTILVVDEASMISAKDMHHLMSAAIEKNARVVLVGDVQQLQSIQAGKAFAQLQNNGIAKADVGEILRQKNSELKRAVELAAKGDISKAISKLGRIVEIDYASERHQKIADDYVKLSGKRDRTIIVAGTNSARDSINERVREGLGLKGEGLVIDTLKRKDFTEAQSRMSSSYSVGDVIQPLKDSKSLDMKRGENATVVDIEAGRITLEKENGNRVTWNPAIQTNIASFEVKEKEFTQGDLVRVSANDYSKALVMRIPANLIIDSGFIRSPKSPNAWVSIISL